MKRILFVLPVLALCSCGYVASLAPIQSPSNKPATPAQKTGEVKRPNA